MQVSTLPCHCPPCSVTCFSLTHLIRRFLSLFLPPLVLSEDDTIAYNEFRVVLHAMNAAMNESGVLLASLSSNVLGNYWSEYFWNPTFQLN